MKKVLIFVFILLPILVGVLAGLHYGVPNTNIKLIGLSGIKIALETSEIVPREKTATNENPKNIIIVIADGMGFSHMSASNLVRHGIHGKSAWEQFDISTWHSPHLINGLVTDSAASATAMSTGKMTINESVAVDENGENMETLFELASANGYDTGIVTDSYLWDATPASFVTHNKTRRDAISIVRQLAESDLDILFGEVRRNPDSAVLSGEGLTKLFSTKFQLIEHGDDLTLIDKDKPLSIMLPMDFAIKPEVEVTLLDLTKTALQRLNSDNENGYVLLVETEEPDSASHRYDFNRLMAGMSMIEDTIEHILEVTNYGEDTLIIFTADHETGGLTLTRQKTNNEVLEPVWATGVHTANPVPLFVHGVGAEQFSAIHSNYEIGQLLHQMISRQESANSAPASSSQ